MGKIRHASSINIRYSERNVEYGTTVTVIYGGKKVSRDTVGGKDKPVNDGLSSLASGEPLRASSRWGRCTISNRRSVLLGHRAIGVGSCCLLSVALIQRLCLLSSRHQWRSGLRMLLLLSRLCRLGSNVGFIHNTWGDIELVVNLLRNRLNLRPQLLLDAVQVESVLVRDQVNREPKVSEPSRPPDAVQVRLRVFGEIKVDDHVHGLDVDPTREKVGADQVAANAVAEVVKHAVAMGLEHLCVRVEARVAELGHFFGEELDAVGRVAEDDGLVDLKLKPSKRQYSAPRAYAGKTDLGKQCVEAMHLLPFFDIGVILRDTTQGKFVHQIDLIRRIHMFIL